MIDILLRKAIEGKGLCLTKEDLENYITEELYEICDKEHSHCGNECPVFALKNSIPCSDPNDSSCDCFKNGKAMLKYLIEG